MTTEEIIKTIDFFPDDANKTPIEKHFSPVEEKKSSNLSVYVEKWKEKVNTASNTMMQQCKQYCQVISESFSKIVIPVADLKKDEKAENKSEQKEKAPDSADNKAISTTIAAGRTATNVSKTEANKNRGVSGGNENHKVGLTRYFLLFLVSELTLLWCSYVIGQHHGMWRYVQAQKAIRYRAKVY